MIELLTALKRVRQLTSLKPKVAMVLGSGLGDVAYDFENRVALPYKDIPDFPRTRVAGHAGNLVFGHLHSVPVVAMQGRVHFYEGHPLTKVVFGVQLMKLLGAHILITANAVGGINKQFRPGDIMLIRDHINLLGDHPLRGHNLDKLGPRFYDMTTAYDPQLRDMAKRVAKKMKMKLREGVYAACMGPSYETPAEIRMLKTIGADAVGMSTVPEILSGRHMSMRCLGISCISNLAAGISKESLSHDEVIETAGRVSGVFRKFLKDIFRELAMEKSILEAGPAA